MNQIKSTTGKISSATMEVIRKHVKSNNETLMNINRWMRDELQLNLKQRIYILDLLEQDLDGFVNKGVIQ